MYKINEKETISIFYIYIIETLCTQHLNFRQFGYFTHELKINQTD